MVWVESILNGLNSNRKDCNLSNTKSDVDDVIPIIKQTFEDLDYGIFEAKDMQFAEQLDINSSQYPHDKDINVKSIRSRAWCRQRRVSLLVWIFSKQERLFNQG